MSKLLLVDGNSILNRAFYGLPDLTTSDGKHTNAILGFLNIVLKVIDDVEADHLCVAFDLKQKTFRHEMYEVYKGTRKPMPEELAEQLPAMKNILKAMNVTVIEKGGYEADDLLGTMSRRAHEKGFQVVLLSGDRDLLQLATEDILVKLPKTKGGKTVMEDYFANDVKEAYGVDPVTFIDMKGLMGDTSDNIPGVPGIGEKTAAKLLIEYGSMENLYEHIDELKKSKMKDNLIEFKEQAFLSKILATIKLDCEIDVDFEALATEDMFNSNSYELFTEYELKSFYSRFDNTDKTTKFEFDYKLIEEYDDAVNAFEAALNNKEFGFYSILNDNELIGCAISFGEDTFIIRVVNFITDSFIFDYIKKAIENNAAIYCMDVKREQKIYSFDENESFNDISLIAYLLNPLKSSYDYDDIARSYLSANLETQKELLGKKKIDATSFDDTELCKLFGYNSVIPILSASKMLEELKAASMYDLYKDIELPCLYALNDMEANGIKVDKEALLSFGDRLLVRIDEITKEIYSLAEEEFNINSTKQLGDILFEKLKLKSGKKTKTGYSTGVEVLEKIKGEHPIVPLILEYRQLTKLNSTYVDGLIPHIMEDSRIHGCFNQTVTATGRISSTEPNLQNIPTRFPLGREIRKVFVPEDGYVLLDADYSQIELRVLAHMSKDETLISAYNSDSDIHSVTASEVFGVPLKEVNSDLRRKAKAVNFGIVYGISSFGLGQDLDISRKEAESYIEKYFATYTKLKEFLDSTVEDAKKLGYSVTMFNRRRPIPELNSSNFMTRSFGERAAMNSPIQGSAADIIKIAMINVNRSLKENKLKSKLILQVHDELMIETANDEIDIVKKLLVEGMMNAANLLVPLIVDVNSGSSWYDAK